MTGILTKIKYLDFKWKIIGDFKVIAILMGLLGYTKFRCFLCEWNSRNKGSNYVSRDWPVRERMQLEEKNVIREPLAREKTLFCPHCISNWDQ